MAANMEPAASAETATLVKSEGPVPMSFPSILRNQGISDRFAHLRVEIPSAQAHAPALASKRRSRDDKEGKRWIRRKENARFTGNPHVVLAAKKDLSIPAPSVHSTFPEPLPAYLSRNTHVPESPMPSHDPLSANAGRFSLSLKGMRRDLRKAGGRAQYLVSVIEDEIVDWLEHGGVMITSQVSGECGLELPGAAVGGIESIREVSRTPLELVWAIADDAFARYVVHCCARYHEVVSFSKDTSSQRLTHLLRPNVTRPDHVAKARMYTPPVTDLSASDVSSDFEFSQSDRDSVADSDVEGPTPGRGLSGLEAITEASVPSSPAIVALEPVMDDGWSVIGGDSDREAEADVEREMSNLVISPPLGVEKPDRTPLAVRTRAFRSVTSSWSSPTHRARSGSSPSPARRAGRRVVSRKEVKKVTGEVASDGRPRSLYDYVFS
ncbi:hypothetical protein NEOLEDRAFT_1099340 [Neolentinus lepideus HHB14362 ss-1]|uniref:Uncharacterized protein n=1 Tax=Neolentinus lepideus HHB14362 ss-1 TaxID=1314782 RepID=A0A165PRL7_9AGAM|nr:hypothetical protein NEOLEDRAFT_1099340 [Neolentinus lepideus HHB14362 ss-1]